MGQTSDLGRRIRSVFVVLWTLLGPMACSPPPEGPETAAAGPEEVRTALKQAVEFFRTRVSNAGGYHFRYASDLSYGRSEAAQGPTQVTVQTSGTPLVGMAYLTAYEATADPYYLEAARETALLLVRGQHCSGGWDYIIELDPEKRRSYPYRVDGDCAERPDSAHDDGTPGSGAASTLDDNVTQGALRLLMRVDRELEFQDAEIHEASLFALDQLARAQYPNGAWPQRFRTVADPGLPATRSAAYPDSWPREWPGPDYRHHYTLNDNAILDVIDTFLEAARIYREPRYRALAEKGGDFLLLAQMPDPQPAWAQQYDDRMHPAWGRIFEPPSVTGSESQAVLQMLLVLYRETGRKKYLEPFPRAVEYLRKSDLPAEGPWRQEDGRCGPGALCLARFYELGTNRPLFITKGSRVRVEAGSSRLLDGYELSYSPESVITHYGLWTDGHRLEQAEQEYRSLLTQGPFGHWTPGTPPRHLPLAGGGCVCLGSGAGPSSPEPGAEPGPAGGVGRGRIGGQGRPGGLPLRRRRHGGDHRQADDPAERERQADRLSRRQATAGADPQRPDLRPKHRDPGGLPERERPVTRRPAS